MSGIKKHYKPPRIAAWLLRRVSSDPFGVKCGDFEEEFGENVFDKGYLRAYIQYWVQLMKSIPGFLNYSIMRSGAMLKSYFKIAVRNIFRNRIYSLINISGLTIGLACCLIVLLYVHNELSYNNFHEKGDRVYRVLTESIRPNYIFRSGSVFTKFAGYAQDNLPEIENTVRITTYGEKMVMFNNIKVKKRILFADSTFFNVFSFPLISGTADRVLEIPNTVVVTRSFADEHYPDEDPVGKIILYDGKYNLTVTGVMEDVPENSDYQFDLVISFTSLRTISGARMFDRGGMGHTTFFLLKDNASSIGLESKMNDSKVFKFRRAFSTTYYLQSLKRMHTEAWSDYGKFGDIRNIYLLSGLAIAILLIACVNYINLSTSFGIRRSKEVGLKKVVGAGRTMLIKQFLGESILLSIIALLFSIVTAYIFLPLFNELSGKTLEMNLLRRSDIFFPLCLVTIAVGIIAGIYPAVFISGFKPVNVIKGTLSEKFSGGAVLRKCLVIFQFTISLILFIGMIIFREQLEFIENKELGFNNDNILSISLMEDVRIGERYELLRDEFMKNPDIIDMTAMHYLPGTYSGYLDGYVPEGRPKSDEVQLALFYVSDNYFDFYNIPVISGRGFDPGSTSDIENTVILNAKAAEVINWDSSLGKYIKFNSEGARYNEKGYTSTSQYIERNMQVIGVSENYHGGSLKDEIKPMMFRYRPDMYNYFSLRINPVNVNEVIAFINEKWSEIAPNMFLDYFFNDERIAEAYQNETKNARIINITSVLAILLAGMGLFGLLSYNIERRIKELGIRKVMGAAVNNLVVLLSKDFLALIMISNIIAWPVAYFVMSRWLENYEYRIDMTVLYFIEAGVITVLIAMIIISSQTIKAAVTNPVDSLRYE
ncbi:MAG: FtsX-like permease family protein [bacterium]|nr:FtsX-like permease family protein [bacterium]